jgi:hypothetical protein
MFFTLLFKLYAFFLILNILKWVQLRKHKCCRRFLIICFVPVRIVGLYAIYLMSIDAIAIWKFTLKLETIDAWKKDDKQFMTNCSAINAFFVWTIWICVEVVYYALETVEYVLVIALLIFLIKSIVSGSLQTFCKFIKEIFYMVLSSPLFFWALFKSYLLGTPFIPPAGTSGADKDLGDKF